MTEERQKLFNRTEERNAFVSPQEELRPAAVSNIGHSSVHCQVCQNLLNLEGKLNQLVVKCSACNEATPIKAPPPGKRYIRCPCKCLLICKSSATRVACPRANCRLVIPISIRLTGEAIVDSMNEGLSGDQTVNVRCSRCSAPFCTQVIMGRSLGKARCPQCRLVSSVGPSYARIRWTIFAILTILSLGAAIGTTVGTFRIVHDHSGIYAVWAALYLCVIILAIRCAQFFFMPVSAVEFTGPAIS